MEAGVTRLSIRLIVQIQESLSSLLRLPLAKRGRNVRSRSEMSFLPGKSQRKEPRGLVVEDTTSVILHYRISDTFKL